VGVGVGLPEALHKERAKDVPLPDAILTRMVDAGRESTADVTRRATDLPKSRGPTTSWSLTQTQPLETRCSGSPSPFSRRRAKGAEALGGTGAVTW